MVNAVTIKNELPKKLFDGDTSYFARIQTMDHPSGSRRCLHRNVIQESQFECG